MRVRTAFMLSACVLGLIVGACGGSSSRSSSAPSLTDLASNKSTFVQRADNICKQASDQVKSVVGPGDPITATREQLPAWSSYLQTILPPIQKEKSDLRALIPPSGDANTINNILSDQATAIQDLQAAQRAAARNDLAGFHSAFDKFNRLYSRVKAEARRYGLAQCSD